MKKEPLWKRLQEWWPIFVGIVAMFGWITTQAVRGAQDEAKIEEHDKKIEAGDVKDKEQDTQITAQYVQFQLIQQSLGSIGEQLKDIKKQGR